MKKCLFCILLISFCVIVNAQASLGQIPPSTLKLEALSLEMKKVLEGIKEWEGDVSEIEIPGLYNIDFKKCNETYGLIEEGSLWGGIKLEGDPLRVSDIRYINHKFLFKIPKTAYTDIEVPFICSDFTKKEKPIKSNGIILRTEDKKCSYIVLKGGNKENPFKICWVIENSKYIGRIIFPTNLPGR